MQNENKNHNIVIVLTPFFHFQISADKYNSSIKAAAGAGDTPGANVDTTVAAELKKIVTIATAADCALLEEKQEEEAALLKICRAKVKQRNLPMHIVDAEYQFDRHKLTFFFEAEGRIDFRELVRDLFSIYKTRIWMQQLDKNRAGRAGEE